jgi:phage recombination protein Bet
MVENPIAKTDSTKSIIAEMAARFGMERTAFEATLRKTVMPAATANEQVAAFLIVAREHSLNPFTKEIYAFPTKDGGIQPVVPIDGWLRIVNSHPSFDGMEIEEVFGDDQIQSVRCTIHRKDRAHPVIVTEYYAECVRNTEQWKQKPIRMLRHKAVIQCARYAFGFAGIIDPDEAERMVDMGEAEVLPAQEATAKRLEGLRRTLGERTTAAEPIEPTTAEPAA